MRSRIFALGLFSVAVVHPALAMQFEPTAASGDRLADALTKRAASAGRLKDAIAALRTRLTPEQLEILASAERPQGPPPGPWGNPPDDAAGPRGLSSPGRQLPPPQPRIGEQL